MRFRSCGEMGCTLDAEWIRASLAHTSLHSRLCTKHWKMLRERDWAAAAGYLLISMEILSKKARSTRLNGKRVVICEDDALTAMQLGQGLMQHGLIVVGRTYAGLQAIELVRTELPDIVLLDIDVPGIAGLIAAEKILALGARVCIVMLTAYSDEASIQHARELGIMGWIVKPVTTSETIARLEMAWAEFEEQNLISC